MDGELLNLCHNDSSMSIPVPTLHAQHYHIQDRERL
jgi:hypothetical protein